MAQNQRQRPYPQIALNIRPRSCFRSGGKVRRGRRPLHGFLREPKEPSGTPAPTRVFAGTRGSVGDAGPYTGFCGNQRSRRGRRPLQARRKSAEKGKSARLRGRLSGRPRRAAPTSAAQNMVVGAHHDAPAKKLPSAGRISLKKHPFGCFFLWSMASGCSVFPLSIECFSG